MKYVVFLLLMHVTASHTYVFNVTHGIVLYTCLVLKMVYTVKR
jgi:hypothetical protein